MASPPAQAARQPQIAITDVTARAVREPVSRRSYLIVSVKTDAGVTGVGEATAAPDAATAVSRILRQKSAVVGQDALAYESLRLRLRRPSPPTGSDGLAPAQAALNMALLDVLGKVTRAPAYDVLGGPTRQKARAFAHLHGDGEDSLRASLERVRAAGYRAFSVPLRMPSGPTRGRSFYRQSLQLLERLRAAAGDESDFILDGGGQLAASEAAGLAAAFEPFHLLWLEEPTADINHKALGKIAAESATPLGVGRGMVDNSGFQDLLRMDAIDVLRPDIARAGISQVRKAAALAETYYVAIAPFHRGGPIGTAAALHAAASMPNFFIQEIPLPNNDRDRAMRRELAGLDLETATDGFLALPGGHGLGITLNEDAVGKYEVRT